MMNDESFIRYVIRVGTLFVLLFVRFGSNKGTS